MFFHGFLCANFFREAQDMGKKHSAELNVKVVDYPNMVYVAGMREKNGDWNRTVQADEQVKTT